MAASISSRLPLATVRMTASGVVSAGSLNDCSCRRADP